MLLTALPMMVCLFWTVFLLTNYFETHDPVRGRLSVFMLAATLLYAGHYVFFNRYEEWIPLSDTVYVYANLSVYPLYLWYIDKLTEGPDRPNFWRLLLFLIPLLVASATWITYQRMDAAQTAAFIDAYLYRGSMEGLSGAAYVQAVIHTVARLLFAVQILPIFIAGNRRLHLFDPKREKGLHGIRFLLMLFAVVSFFSFVSNLVGRHQFSSSHMLLAVPSVAFSVFLYYIGYLGYSVRPNGPTPLPLPVREESNYPHSETFSSPPSQEEVGGEPVMSLREQIEHLMKVEGAFLQPNLKISDMAQRLGSNRNYIYEAINKEMGMSFSEYVNRLRVAHSQELMKKHPDMLLGEVAVKSGFSSMVSFYRSFKKYVGCAPKEWQSDHHE